MFRYDLRLRRFPVLLRRLADVLDPVDQLLQFLMTLVVPLLRSDLPMDLL